MGRPFAFVLLLLTAAIAPAAAAQKEPDPVCPYCKNDPKILAGAGLVGHGPMPFGKSTSDDVKSFLSYATPLFLESAHFRIASTLEAYTIPEKDWKKYEAELAALRKKLPGFPEKTRRLDPWLRLHLYAERSEGRYARFLALLKMTDKDFYDKREYGVTYRGEGKYLGMQDKYEAVLLRDLRQFKDLLREQTGATTALSKREHFVGRGVLSIFIPVIEDLRQDDNLFAHLTHNYAHNFVLGYKHYSYEPPKWFEEGFAHFMEKEVSEDFNSFDSEEAAVAPMYEGKDWRQAVLKLASRGKATSLADLTHKKGLSDLGKEDHLVAWSKVDFFVNAHPDKFPKFLEAIRGRLGTNGLPDGSNLPAIQRDFFKTEMGWNLSDFDVAWEKWVQKTYVSK